MNKKLDNSSITEAVVVSAVLVIFAIISANIFQLFDFLFPIPIIILAGRKNFRYATISAVCATLVILLILGIQLSIMYLCIYTPLALTIAYFVSKNKKPFICIFSGTVVVIVGVVVITQICKLFLNFEIAKEFDVMIDQFFKINKDIIAGMSFSDIQVKSMEDMMSMLLNLIKQLVPTFIIISAITLSLVNYMITCLLAKRLKIKIEPIKDLMFFKLPKSFILGVILMLIITGVLSSMGTTSYEIVTTNIIVLISICFLLQGLAVIKFYLVKKKVNTFLRFVIIIAIILIQYLSILAMCIGLGDYILNLRRLNTIK